MRYLAGFVFFALALGTLRLAGCGDGDDVECESDADCDDGDPCTSEFCRLECSFVSHSTGCNPDSSPEPDCITNVCVYSSTPHAVCADGRICLVPDGYVAEAHLVCANPLCQGVRRMRYADMGRATRRMAHAPSFPSRRNEASSASIRSAKKAYASGSHRLTAAAFEAQP